MATVSLLGIRMGTTKRRRSRRRMLRRTISRQKQITYHGGATADIDISPLKIVCDVRENGGSGSSGSAAAPIALEYSMINYDKTGISSATTKKYGKYPFFSSSVKYPSHLKSKKYEEIVDFFFNRITFMNVLQKECLANPAQCIEINASGNPDAKQLRENEIHNVMFMLTYLFRIIPASYINPKNSYENFILGKTPFRLQFASGNSPTIMSIVVGSSGEKKLITDLIWLNDVYNHPKYLEFITTFVETKEKKRALVKNIASLENKKKTALIKTMDDLSSSPSLTALKNMYASPSTSLSNSFINATMSIWQRIAPNVNNVSTLNDTSKIQASLDLVEIYLDYLEYNKKDSNQRSYYSMDKQLLDKLNKIYNAAIGYKAAEKCKKFVDGGIIQLNLKKKNNDGSDIQKMDLDIVNEIETNYKPYVSLNREIENSLKSVYAPERSSSNLALYDILNSFKGTDAKDQQEKYKIIIYLYNKYVLGKMMEPLPEGVAFTDEMMYTGVNTTVGVSGTGADEIAQETKEIYLAVDLISEDLYLKTPGCVYADAKLANKLEYLLDGVMHSVDKYRGEKVGLVAAKPPLSTPVAVPVSAPSSAPVAAAQAVPIK